MVRAQRKGAPVAAAQMATHEKLGIGKNRPKENGQIRIVGEDEGRECGECGQLYNGTPFNRFLEVVGVLCAETVGDTSGKA